MNQLPSLRHVVAGFVALAATASLQAQDRTTPAPWITDEAPFLEMCTHDTLLRVLRFADAAACESAVKASAAHCNQVLTEDFAGKPEAAPETASRRAFLRGAGQGCFMAQMDGRTDGRFVPVLQHLAKAAREGRKPQD